VTHHAVCVRLYDGEKCVL